MDKDLRAELTKTKKLLSKANKELLKVKAECAIMLGCHHENLAEKRYAAKYAKAGENELLKTIRDLNGKLRDHEVQKEVMAKTLRSLTDRLDGKVSAPDVEKPKAYWVPTTFPDREDHHE